MAAGIVDWGSNERKPTDSVSVLQGATLGAYPSGNSVLVRGSSESILIADFYVTFHQKGVIEGRETFLTMLDKFHSVIGRRHDEMLDYMSEPRTLDEMAEHRFVYRPHVDIAFVETVERRTAELHVARMLERGEAVEVDHGRSARV